MLRPQASAKCAAQSRDVTLPALQAATIGSESWLSLLGGVATTATGAWKSSRAEKRATVRVPLCTSATACSERQVTSQAHT